MALTTLTARVDEKDKITFEPFFSETNMTYVKKSLLELKAGKGTAHELIEVEDE